MKRPKNLILCIVILFYLFILWRLHNLATSHGVLVLTWIHNGIFNKVFAPIVGVSNSRLFWLLDQISNFLIQLATVNCENYHFKFQNWSWDAKSYKFQKWKFSLFKWSHRPLQLYWLSTLEYCLCFENIAQSHLYTCLLSVHPYLQAYLSGLRLEHKCPIEKSHHIRHTYLTQCDFEMMQNKL